MIAEISEAARSLALQAQVFRPATSSEIDLVFADLARDRVDALFVAHPQHLDRRLPQWVPAKR